MNFSLLWFLLCYNFIWLKKYVLQTFWWIFSGKCITLSANDRPTLYARCWQFPAFWVTCIFTMRIPVLRVREQDYSISSSHLSICDLLWSKDNHGKKKTHMKVNFAYLQLDSAYRILVFSHWPNSTVRLRTLLESADLESFQEIWSMNFREFLSLGNEHIVFHTLRVAQHYLYQSPNSLKI